MFNKDLAFDVDDNGILIEGGPHIIGGVAVPTSLTPTVPTVYIQTNGAIWTHQGPSGSWVQLGNVQNFSYHKVDGNVVIPNGQQMITEGQFEITPTGCFAIEPEGKFILKTGV